MYKKTIFRSGLITMAITAVCSLSMAPAAVADTPRSVNVVAGNLVDALEFLAKQCGVDVIYPSSQLKGLKTVGVSGVLETREAFQKLIEGTPLIVTEEGGSVLITLPGEAGAVQRQGTTEGDGSLLLAQADPAAPRSNADGLAEVLIEGARTYAASDSTTGTKTDTPLMETPLSIQVISQQVLQDQKITILDQALRNVSGVRSSNVGGIAERITMRGFTTNATFRNGFRIDEYTNGGLKTLSNVESIEVMKGPAAILYGRVEPGGLVNLVTKQPRSTPHYSLEQQVGSYDHYLTDLDATGPLNEEKTVLYRLVASYEKNHSFRDAVYNEKVFVAPTLKWNISGQTQVTLEAEYTHNPLITDEGYQLPYDTANKRFVWLPRSRNLIPSKRVFIDTTYVGLNWSHRFNEDWSIRQQIMSHQSKLDADEIKLIAAFNQAGSTWTADRTFVAIHDAGNTTRSTVVDLTGHFATGGLKHTLLLGADYYRLETPFSSFQSNVGSTIDVFSLATSGDPLVLDPGQYGISKGINDNYGLYAQDQIRLIDNVHLLAGLRYQRAKHRGTSTTGTGYGGTGLPVADATQDDHAVTPRVGLLWQAQRWLSLYGNYAENFGANNGRDFQGAALDPETAQQYELGAKTEFFDGKLTSSMAVYELTKQNVAVADPNPLHFGYSLTVGAIRSRGLEFDIQGEVRPGWNVIATYSYTDAVIVKSTPGSFYVEGARRENIPRNMASLSTTYDFEQGSLRGWKVGGGVTLRSSTTSLVNADFPDAIITPAHAVVDAMASREFKAGRNVLTAQLNVNNILDKSYYLDAVAYGNVGVLSYGTPRSVLASLKMEF